MARPSAHAPWLPAEGHEVVRRGRAPAAPSPTGVGGPAAATGGATRGAEEAAPGAGASSAAWTGVPVPASRALWRAAVDLYHHSLRMLLLNGALMGTALAILWAASYVEAALLLLLALGPIAMGLAHAAVRLAATGELALRDALGGLRLHWRRGLQLAAALAAAFVVGAVAIAFYLRMALWPLAALCLYLLGAVLLLQIWLWPRAAVRPGVPLRRVLPEAAVAMLRRPWSTLGVGAALLAVNAVGAVLVLPLLTLTVSYSFLAAAHLALPEDLAREAETTWPR